MISRPPYRNQLLYRDVDEPRPADALPPSPGAPEERAAWSVAADTARPAPPSPPNTEARRSLHEFVDIVRRGWRLILGLLLLVVVGTVLYALLTTPQYESYSVLLVDTDTADERSEFSEVLLGFIDRPGIGSAKLANEGLILEQSLLIAERTVERLEAMGADPETGVRLTLLEDDEFETVTERAQLLQEDYLDIEPATDEPGGADAFRIVAASELPAEAALIANIYTEEYVQRTRELSSQRIVASRRFLENQLARQRDELRATEEALQSYMSRQGAVALDEEASFTVAQIAQLEAALDEARIEADMREASLEAMEQELRQLRPRLTQRVASGLDLRLSRAQSEIADLDILIDQIYLRQPELRQNPSMNEELLALLDKRSGLQAEVNQLAERYVEEILAVSGADPNNEISGMNRIMQLREQIAQERIQLIGARARETTLGQRLGNYTAELRNLPRQSIQLAQLERANQSAEQLYLTLSEKLQEVRLAEESEIGFAQIIRPALTPERPVWPRLGRLLALSLLLGLLIGFAAAVVRHRLDTKIYSPEELRAQGFVLLGTVPDMNASIREDYYGAESTPAQGRVVRTTLVAFLQPFSASAEAYRRLYLQIQYSRPRQAPQTLLITSAEPDSGKTTTAYNLAFTAAQAGQRTLLIDADLHRPALHRQMDLPESPSLPELLQQSSARLDTERFASGIENLYVVTTPTPAEQPKELLQSRRMQDLLVRLRTTFDVIIFDAPPALSAIDATVLSAQCDATLLVTAAGQTDARALRQARDELRSVGAAVVGAVLNRFDASTVPGYYPSYRYAADRGGR